MFFVFVFNDKFLRRMHTDIMEKKPSLKWPYYSTQEQQTHVSPTLLYGENYENCIY